MLDKASLKLGLDRAVLQSMSGNKDSNVNGVRKPTQHEHTLLGLFLGWSLILLWSVVYIVLHYSVS